MKQHEAQWRCADVRGTPPSDAKGAVLRAVESAGWCATCDATGKCPCGCGDDCGKCGGNGRSR